MQPQSGKLFCIELEAEVGGKTFLVARYLLVEPLDGYTVKFGEVNVEDDALMS